MKNLVIITTNHSEEVLERNVKRSQIIQHLEKPLMVVEDQKNVSKSYNNGLKIVEDAQGIDYIMCLHEDVFMPEAFEAQFMNGLSLLPSNWAVLGVAGVMLDSSRKRVSFGNISDRGREWGKAIYRPMPVQTVDELMIILNPKAGLKFDEQFDLDFYGADICMQAHEKGLGVFAVPGYVQHNSTRAFGGRTPSFYANEKRFQEKWKHMLPICTTCSILI